METWISSQGMIWMWMKKILTLMIRVLWMLVLTLKVVLAPEVQNWSEEQGLTGTGSNKFMKDFNPKSSERGRRKKKKVQYYNDTSARTKCGQVEYHAGMYHFGTIQSKDFTVYRTDKTLGFK